MIGEDYEARWRSKPPSSIKEYLTWLAEWSAAQCRREPEIGVVVDAQLARAERQYLAESPKGLRNVVPGAGAPARLTLGEVGPRLGALLDRARALRDVAANVAGRLIGDNEGQGAKGGAELGRPGQVGQIHDQLDDLGVTLDSLEHQLTRIAEAIV